MNFFKEWKLFRIMSTVSYNVIENIWQTTIVQMN